MPLVNVMVSGRAYTIACDEGEEEHLKDLASHVDSKVRELLESVGQVGAVYPEPRLRSGTAPDENIKAPRHRFLTRGAVPVRL